MSPFVVRWIKLSLVAVVGCGFLAMAIYAFINRDEIRSAQIEPPLITAADEPLKRRPDQPGGMEIPNRDKLVFDLLDSDSTVSGAAMMNNEFEPSAGDEMAEEEPVAPAVQTPLSVPQDETVAAPVAEPVVAEPAPTVAAPAAPAVAQPAKPAEQPRAVPAAGGSWGVQLAAVGSRADGEKAAAKMQAQYAALKPLTPNIVATPDGKHYRVQFVGAASRNAAQAVCGKLGKQACFPVAPK